MKKLLPSAEANRLAPYAVYAIPVWDDDGGIARSRWTSCAVYHHAQVPPGYERISPRYLTEAQAVKYSYSITSHYDGQVRSPLPEVQT